MKSFIKDVVVTFIESIIILAIIVSFIAIPVRVVGSSMEPTLYNGYLGFSDVFKKWLGIERFDVVIIESDKTKEKIVKRVIGLPNEKVEYRDNKLYINDEYVMENYQLNSTTEDFVISLNDNEYFCMGDNRYISKDSRYYGPFEKEDIKAVGVLVLFPFDNIGLRWDPWYKDFLERNYNGKSR